MKSRVQLIQSSRIPRLVLRVACIVVLAFFSSFASASDAKEGKIKVAFIYNFAKFVTWPESTFGSDKETVRVCLSNFHWFKDALPSYKKKKIGKRHLEFIDASTLNSFDKCHLLYLSDHSLIQDKSVLENPGLISVGEEVDFLDRGGIIQFYTDKNKLRFAIDLNNAKQVGVVFNSRLLRLAKVVGRD